MAVNKNIGGRAQGANDFLAPYAPTIGTATNVGTSRAYNNGAATVTFTPDSINAATSYTVTASTGQTGTGSSSPITVTGIASTATPTFTVTATNSYGTSTASAASNSITITTVPDTVATPSVSTVAIGGASPAGTAATANDTVSWTAPANGGSAITNYYWTSSDGKSGNTASTSVVVSQESGTQQTYSVYATNANGNGGTGTSALITSAFSFTPFSVFSFSPFGVFGFSPFSVFGFSPFSVFGFSPFGVFGFSPFSVFGFSPFGVFGFSPFTVFGFSPFGVFGFSPVSRCVDQDTPVAIPGPDNTILYKTAKEIMVGDEVCSATWDELIDESFGAPYDEPSATLTNITLTTTRIVSVQPSAKATTVYFNNDINKRFSMEEQMLIKRNDMWQFTNSGSIILGDILITKNADHTFGETPVTAINVVDAERVVYMFDCEPTDTLVAGDIVVHNAKTFN
jgi:hypothetical protein